MWYFIGWLVLKKKVGQLAENLASRKLREMSFTVLGRNRRFFGVEIDFLCQKDGSFFLIEVKRMRKKHYFQGYPPMTHSQYRRQLEAIERWRACENRWIEAFVGIMVIDESQEILDFNPRLEYR